MTAPHTNNTAVDSLLRAFWSSETAVLVTFAVIVGLGTGTGTVIFIRMIALFTSLFQAPSHLLPMLGGAYVILMPAIGGLFVGPLVYFVAPEAKGHGVPEVLTAIATKRGHIRPVVVLAKALGSAVTIGSGGSVGREGPIVQIGSALGSTIGQLFKLPERRIVNLVASGAAAGIAATFNTPIAGVMFALEVILADFGIQTFSTIVISAITASIVSRAVLGDYPAFVVPAYTLRSYWELILYLGLGLVAGLAAFAFMKLLHLLEDGFDAWRIPPYLKPAVGGLFLGLLGYLVPDILGIGFGTIHAALTGQTALVLLCLLIFAKILATSLTLGSGASGGVFAPALFIGAMVGGAYGHVAGLVLPGITAPSGAYAMVGMAAVFAGAARAPITAILILFEMTQDYRIILPLMFATVVSTILAQWFEPESIYTFKLKRRGLDVRAKKDENLMRAILVEEAMTPSNRFTSVRPETPLTDLPRLFQVTGHHGIMVLDANDELFGIVTLTDLERAMETNRMSGTVKDICTTRVLTAFPDETLDEALRHFGALDVGRVPVVDRHNPRKLVGVLRRSDVVRAYSHGLVDRHYREQHLERLRLETETGAELVEICLRLTDPAAHRQLKDLVLPEDCVVVSIRRAHRLVIPRGHTELLPGDCIIVLAKDESLHQLHAAFQGLGAGGSESAVEG